MNSSADTGNTGLFSELPADAWWQEQGQFRTLHALNHARIHFVRSITAADKDWHSNSSILDAGCGGGILSIGLARVGYAVTGVDQSANAIEAAKRQSELEGLTKAEFVHSDMLGFCTSNKQRFDMACCMELVEHVDDPGETISLLSRQLRPGGHMVLSTLNRSLCSYLVNILAAEYALRLLPIGTHDWQSFVTPSEMSAMLSNANCKVMAMAGIRLLPLLWRSTLVSNPGHHYIVHAVKNKD